MPREREGCSSRSRGWAKSVSIPAACRSHSDKTYATMAVEDNSSPHNKKEANVVCALSSEVLIFFVLLAATET